MCPMKYSTWIVITRCKFFNYNDIMKKGYDNDKALVEAYNTKYNNPHNQRRKWNSKTFKLLCRGGAQGIFRACTCIFAF